MFAVDLVANEKLELRDVPRPELRGDRDVLLKVERVGLCGSDVHYYANGRIGSQVIEQYPWRLGHECSATVVEVGKAAKRVAVGDHVAVDPAMPCFNCDQCLAGRENTCRHLKFLGCPGQALGCLSEYLVMPETSIFRTDGKITLEQAALVEPLSIAVHAVRQAAVRANNTVGILGCGPMGLSILVAGRAEKVGNIYMTDKITERLELSQKGTADWTGNPDETDVVGDILRAEPLGLDVVFECAGAQDTIDQAIALLKPGGTLSLVGIPSDDRVSLWIDQTRRKELRLINVRRQIGCVPRAIDIMAAGDIAVDFMMTHAFGYEQTAAAFELVAGYRDGVGKAMIAF